MNILGKIEERYLKLIKEVEQYGKNVSIVVVTKYVENLEILSKLYQFGVTDIAENYAQQMEKKYNGLSALNFDCKKYRWHFIGHLQTNKVKKVVPITDLIQSLDSIQLAEKINQTAQKLNKIQNCLLELKVSPEESKFGIEKEKIYTFVENLISCNFTNLKIRGLMSMAPYFELPEKTRPYFKTAKQVFDEIRKQYKEKMEEFNILSLGMSNDYRIALEEGANMIRIGSLLFEDLYKLKN
ncbi:MAG: YggS family pyridoxal phosphate-dependent enzyme [Endomicrobia bacterium]|nr:YggS family pyridoxal phosphate-dependent enzyme [Endomicrobiia bacterium]